MLLSGLAVDVPVAVVLATMGVLVTRDVVSTSKPPEGVVSVAGAVMLLGKAELLVVIGALVETTEVPQ